MARTLLIGNRTWRLSAGLTSCGGESARVVFETAARERRCADGGTDLTQAMIEAAPLLTVIRWFGHSVACGDEAVGPGLPGRLRRTALPLALLRAALRQELARDPVHGGLAGTMQRADIRLVIPRDGEANWIVASWPSERLLTGPGERQALVAAIARVRARHDLVDESS